MAAPVHRARRLAAIVRQSMSRNEEEGTFSPQSVRSDSSQPGASSPERKALTAKSFRRWQTAVICCDTSRPLGWLLLPSAAFQSGRHPLTCLVGGPTSALMNANRVNHQTRSVHRKPIDSSSLKEHDISCPERRRTKTAALGTKVPDIWNLWHRGAHSKRTFHRSVWSGSSSRADGISAGYRIIKRKNRNRRMISRLQRRDPIDFSLLTNGQNTNIFVRPSPEIMTHTGPE
jgi:hypothetical protein